MIRLWLIIGLAVLVIWYLYQKIFLKTKEKNSAEDFIEPQADNNERKSFPLWILLVCLAIGIFIFLILPRLGIYPLAFIQKLLPILGVLRNLL